MHFERSIKESYKYFEITKATSMSSICSIRNYTYSQDFKYLHEKDVSCGISASMYNKCLLLDVTASTGPDRQLTSVLKI